MTLSVPEALPESAGKSALFYWSQREGHLYYGLVREWMEELSPGRYLLDVGAWDTPVASWGRFEKRVSLDIQPRPFCWPGVDCVTADWMDCRLEERADLVLCLQVLEHLGDDLVTPFTRKLLTSGRHVLISVPYRWPRGKQPSHLQDPVEASMLMAWAGKSPFRQALVTEPQGSVQRLVALFQGT